MRAAPPTSRTSATDDGIIGGMTDLLQGINVIDFGSFVAAPAATTAMSDFGANVIKVEPPEGDSYRRLLATRPIDYFWLLTSRNKRGLALDLKTPDAHPILDALIDWADVLVTNYRGSLLDKLGLDYEELRTRNPRLIFAHLAGYGRNGPEAERPAFDTTAWWGRSGIQEFTRDVGGRPVISAPGMGDHAAAMSLFGAVMAALYRRERTGEGAYVGTSLLANGIWSNGMVLQAMLGGEDWSTLKHSGGSPRQSLADLYQSADERWIQLSLLNPAREWPQFAAAMDRLEWLEDARFATPEDRLEHVDALESTIAEVIATLPLSEFRERMDARGLTYGFAARNHELVDDAQILDNEMLVPTAEGEGVYGRTVSNPIYIEGEKKRTPSRAPEIGEHTREILAELGFTAQRIEDWLDKGVVAAPGNAAGQKSV